MTSLLSAATFPELIRAFENLLNSTIGVLFVLATVVFLFGVIKYVLASQDSKAVEEGRKYMIYGIIGLFVMFSVWGIVNAIANTFFGGSTQGNGSTQTGNPSLYSDSESCVQAGYLWNSSSNSCQ